jgi:hypothetical protein
VEISYPKRFEELELLPADDGFIIHEEARDRVHYLNPAAAAVLQLCDGATSDDEIARALQQHFELSEPPADEVSKILEQFAEEGLIMRLPGGG